MNKKYVKLLPFIILLLGVAASAMVFLPALKYADLETTYTGIQVITGVDILNLGPIANAELPFCLLALLAFALPILAGVVAFIMPKSSLIAVVLFIAAAILLFVLPEYVKLNISAFGGGSTEYEVNWVLQIGTIIAGSLSAAAAVLSLFSSIQKN